MMGLLMSKRSLMIICKRWDLRNS